MFSIDFKLQIGVDEVSSIVNQLFALTKKEVLVGVPEDKNARSANERIGNAMLAYIHDNGSPLANIPARPFMIPGINKVREPINDQMLAATKAQLNGDEEGIDQALNKAGLIAQNSIRGVINEGEGFEPLKRGTKLARLRRRKEAKTWSKERREEVMESMHPLVDQGFLRNSITYVIEEKT